jgi:hypothetical protein
VIQEQDGDPFAVMMPTTEIIRFYYASVNRMIGLCLRNRNTFESPLPNFPRDDRLEPRAIDNNKAPLPPTNDSTRGEFDCQFVADVSPTQEVKL